MKAKLKKKLMFLMLLGGVGHAMAHTSFESNEVARTMKIKLDWSIRICNVHFLHIAFSNQFFLFKNIIYMPRNYCSIHIK